jgi:type V secretory pathway adhesin AidA
MDGFANGVHVSVISSTTPKLYTQQNIYKYFKPVQRINIRNDKINKRRYAYRTSTTPHESIIISRCNVIIKKIKQKKGQQSQIKSINPSPF